MVKMIHKTEARILMTQRETTMITEIRVRVANDAFALNDLVALDHSAYGDDVTLAAADWLAKRTPRDEALVDVIQSVYLTLRTRAYNVWLLVGDPLWQRDTRIARYRKKFNSLKAQGVDFETAKDREEIMLENQGKLKFFGAVRLDEHMLDLAVKTMLPGSCTYILALPSDVPVFLPPGGWTGRLCDDANLIKPSVEMCGVIFQRIGYFDDAEVGLIALGRQADVTSLVENYNS